MTSVAKAVRRHHLVPTSSRTSSCQPKMLCWIFFRGAVIVVPFLLYFWATTRKSPQWNSSSSKQHSQMLGGLKKGPVAVDNTEFLWQAPGDGPAQAILFLAHGCGHNMKDWWPATPAVCDDCIGLPEERAIVKIALDLHFAVVAVSSLGTCWSSADAPRVMGVLEEVHRDLQLPIYAFGASSGGSFVSTTLPESFSIDKTKQLSGYIAQIAAPRKSPKRIPAVFITMNRDLGTEQRVTDAVEALRSDDVPVKHIRLPPLQVDSDFFASRIGEEYADRSHQMVDALEKNGLLQGGFLASNPRKSEWRQHLSPFALDSMVADESALSEVLNCAWAAHEMSRDGVRDALSFLLSSVNVESGED